MFSLCFSVCLSVSIQAIKFRAFLAFRLMLLWCGWFAAASGERRHWQVSMLNLQISKSDCCLCCAPVCLMLACKQQRFLTQRNMESSFRQSLRDNSFQIQSSTHTHVECGCYRHSLEVRLTRFQNTACWVESVLDGSVRFDGRKTDWCELEIRISSCLIVHKLTTSRGFMFIHERLGLKQFSEGKWRTAEFVEKSEISCHCR